VTQSADYHHVFATIYPKLTTSKEIADMKQVKIEVRKTVSVDAETLWPTIAKGTGVNEWFPVITTCRVDGTQRLCTMDGGGALEETLLGTDNATRTFCYSVDKHPLPWGPVTCSMQVKDAGMGKSEIIWLASLECADDVIPQARQMLTGLYSQGIDALEAFHEPAM
jgi:Polyketide cyclase / dehydrase and lipid transport